MMTVLVVDDDRQIADSIIQYLEMQGIACDFASDGISALSLIASGSHDVVLLDINMPRLDGFNLCKSIRARGIDTPVLMMTARDTLEDKLLGFESGTDDYLVKPFAMGELHARIKALAGRRSGNASMLQVGDLVMDVAGKAVSRAGTPIAITPSGWRILETLMRASPSVVSRTELEKVVWNGSPPDSDALKVHLHHLRLRIDKPFPKAMIRNIPGHGFAIRGD
jgi:DNA-binding response OmpR family regulator